MSIGNCRFFLLSLLLVFLTVSCGRQKEDIKNESNLIDAQTADQDKPNNPSNVGAEASAVPPAAIVPVNPQEVLPIDDSISSIPINDFPYVPALGRLGGGGGGIRRPTQVFPCEGGTSDCNDHNPCTLDSCDDSDHCVHSLDPQKSEPGSCEVDGNACTVGKCVLVGLDVLCHEEPSSFFAAPLGCNDGNDCTSDSCVRTPLADATPGDQFDAQGNIILDETPQCVNEIVNGLACFVEDQCIFGVCTETGTGDPNAGFQIVCVENGASAPQPFCPRPVDADPCQLAVCTVGVGCEIVNAPNDTVCDDSSPCTENDICTAGVCGGTPLNCNDTIACTTDFCDGSGVCQHIANNNACTPSTNACEENICVAGTGCTLRDKPSGFPCSDADPCTLEDSCDGEGSCESGATLSCPDNDDEDCRVPVCTTGVGCGFSNATMGASCEADDSVCTVDTCNDAGACVAGTPLVCASDGNPCTIESCDATLGCQYAEGNNGAECDDNNACTTGEVCSDGECLGGTDVDCDDGNVCTDDFCAAIGECFHTNLNGPVGNACVVSTDNVFGICLNGYTQCDNGVEMTDMCVQIFRAGDKEEICENGLDDDCDGETDEAICACPDIPPGNNVFYVAPAPTGDDTADCSEANPCATIQHAHDVASSGDAIVVAAGTYNEFNIGISKNLYIVGQGAGVTIVDGGGIQVFVTGEGVSLILCGITVQNAAPGLFNNGGDAQVFNSEFTDSNATFGAGILNTGTLLVASTTISNNTATVTGGGILNVGTASIISSTFQNNTAGAANSSNGQGGGISNIFTMTITDSLITGNDALGPTAANVQGGGIYNNGTMDIFTSTIDANTSSIGAGIVNAANANLDITDSTISNNSVSDAAGTGGGLRNGSGAIMTLTGTTVNNNSAADGAGIYQLGSLSVTNSTISTNTATSEGGGIYNGASTSLSTTTINDNIATSGASIFLNIGTVTATHTIVANPSGATNCNLATVADTGFNFDDDASCGLPTSAALNLGSLQDNGGPTFTHALVNPSDAIDAGDTSCGVTTDQRGEPRPVDFGTADPNPLCDIGAFEVQN